ncbi:hypothetical protein EXU48_13750 [Occultella glacieicola]|uniref:HTH luxR-type domain-containing protein n=1 Tax=Occultella glacieicola TaxID=2518684 RepID=A0ABY2E1W7_9MICO|nr:LuxR C-terminal-related transcriptional regulator [Occultella glacieicola]TDE92604.1 hypothetical protein EXU48_13750 [Occultella glacieicola]
MSRTRLRPALSPSYLVHRQRLYALLDESVTSPVTLVVAPAGSGKTALLAGWMAQSPLPCAWVSLEEADRDPVQMWRAVAAALDSLAPGCATLAARRLRRGGHFLEAVGELLDDLEARTYTLKVLVIDDVHLIDGDDEAAESMAIFLQHLPEWLHVVIASRRSPRLPVNRLRARGQLGEVHFAELRFSFEEARAMLARLVPTLEPDVVAELATKASGWAASIQFAALAARSARARGEEPLEALDGSAPVTHDDLHYLEDYLWQEVLGSESADLIDVMLTASVVPRLGAGLARILASRTDAGELLARAEERGLFVSRNEPSGEFEIHTLVRDLLTRALEQRSPGRFQQLHAWAAAWYEAHGQTTAALDSWLRAHLPRRALRLLAKEVVGLFDDGHVHTILRVIGAIPDAVASEDAESRIEYAWCHLFVDHERFDRLVDDLAGLPTEDVDPVLAARCLTLQAIAATGRGSWTDGSALARTALSELGETWWLDPLGRYSWNLIGRNLALSERWDESSAGTQEVIHSLTIAPERRFVLEGTRALGEALAGRPVNAIRIAAGVRGASEDVNLTVLRMELATAEGIARREVGDAQESLRLLQELSADHIASTLYCCLLAHLELVQAGIADGALDAANEAFGSAAELVDTAVSGPAARSWLARTGTVLAIAGGDLTEARSWALRVEDPFWAPVSEARILLASHEAGRAFDVLKGAEPRCERHRVVAGLLRSRSVAGTPEANEHLLEAVRVASAHGLVQTVAAEGMQVLEDVERLAWQVPAAWLTRLRRAAAPTERGSASPLTLIDPLTERELEVLRMLPSRLTLREIASELFISINTLKFHLKVIYRKLDCNSRAEASEAARALASRGRAVQPSITRRR